MFTQRFQDGGATAPDVPGEDVKHGLLALVCAV